MQIRKVGIGQNEDFGILIEKQRNEYLEERTGAKLGVVVVNIFGGVGQRLGHGVVLDPISNSNS